jgi:hypothetical protein
MKFKEGKYYSITLAGSDGLYVREEYQWVYDSKLERFEKYWTEQYETPMTIIFICRIN